MDEKGCWKLDRQNMLKYFGLLHKNMGNFEGAANVTEECFEDVWHEMDMNSTGFITWHQVRFFLDRVEIHEKELADERQRLEEERQERLRLEQERKEAERKRKEEEDALRRAQENGSDDGY